MLPTGDSSINRRTDREMVRRKSELRRTRRGNNIRQWECRTCRQAFVKKEHLLRHEASHTKQRPFSCGQCPKTYTRHDSLKRHAKKHEAPASGAIPDPFTQGTTETSNTSRSPGNTFDVSGLGVGMQQQIVLIHQPDDLNEADSQNVGEAAEMGFGEVGSMFQNNFWYPFGAMDQMPFTFMPLTASIGNDSLGVSWFPDHENSRGFGLEAAAGNQPRKTTNREAVKAAWFTRPTVEAPCNTKPLERPHDSYKLVDQACRQNLSRNLKVRDVDDELPPVNFLNLCVKMYFIKFHPVFPVIHAASFTPLSENSLLLLSIFSIGALFIGSESSRVKGREMFRRLNRAVLSEWETHLEQGNEEALTVIQAMTLAQNFGMLSGEPADLRLTESLHGTVIGRARQVGVFRIRNTFSKVDVDGETDLESAWRQWIRAEEGARIALALHLHDSQFAAMFHHEPLLRHNLERLPMCCSEPIFGAQSPQQWESMVKESQSTVVPAASGEDIQALHTAAYASSPINAYTSLACIHASISEATYATLNEGRRVYFNELLLHWRKIWFPQGFESGGVSGWATIQWHQCFMLLYGDFDLLERAVGREGQSKETGEAVDAVGEWTKTVKGQWCAAHALLILERLEQMPTSMEPGIHIPLAAFQAGLVLASHLQSSDQAKFEVMFDASELNATNFENLSRVLGGHGRGPKREIDVSALPRIADLLRRQGHWGISKRFALILDILTTDFLGLDGLDG